MRSTLSQGIGLEPMLGSLTRAKQETWEQKGAIGSHNKWHARDWTQMAGGEEESRVAIEEARLGGKKTSGFTTKDRE